MKKIFIVFAIIIVTAGIGLLSVVMANRKSPVSQDNCAANVSTITYTAQQEFAPSCVKVKTGTTLTFINQSAKTLEVGADPHPVHTGNKEVSNGQFTLDVDPGQSANTMVTKTGTFGYHDHEHAASRGIIIVE